MIVGWQDIGQLNDNNADSIQRSIIIPAKEALRQTRQALTGNLTIRDNQYAAIVTLGTSVTPMTSGTEWTFANPLATKPIGFTVLTATNTVGVAIQLDSPPKLSTSRTDGLLGLTAVQDVNGATGGIGESVRAYTNRANFISLGSATAKDIASIQLSAGDWDISFVSAWFAVGSPTDWQTGISLTQDTLPTLNTSAGDSEIRITRTFSTNAEEEVSVPSVAVTPNASTTYHLVSQVTYTGTSVSAFGRISARRMVRRGSNPLIVTGILWGG